MYAPRPLALAPAPVSGPDSSISTCLQARSDEMTETNHRLVMCSGACGNCL